MDRQRLLDLYDLELRINLDVPGLRRDVFPDLVRFVRPESGMNAIHYSRLDEKEIDTIIDEQVAYLRKIDQPFSWHVFEHDKPSNLGDKLVQHGFVPDDDPDRILLLELEAYLPSRFITPSEWRLLQVKDADHLRVVAKIEQDIYGGDFEWLIGRLKPHLEIQDYLSVYIVYFENTPVCTGWIYFNPGSHFASMYGGATLPEFRGRGVYQSLVDIRVREAKERGYSYVVTGASEMSRTILARKGFANFTTSTDYVWKSDEPAEDEEKI